MPVLTEEELRARPSFRAAVILLVSVLCLLAGSVRAQTPPARVELVGCPDELQAAVEAALDVELSIAGADARRGLEVGTVTCTLLCDPTGTTAVVSHGADRVEQRVEGGGPGLARRLAIALAELLEASSDPPAVSIEDAALVEAASAPELEDAPDSPAADPPTGLRTRLRIAGGAWLGGEPFAALGTLELGVELGATPNVAVVLGVAGTLGRIDVEAARLDVRLLSFAASLRFGGDVGPVGLSAGPAIRGGPVFWTGNPIDRGRGVGRDLVGGWLATGVVAAVFVDVPDLPLRIGLEAEGGAIVLSSGALVLGALAARIGGGLLEVRVGLDVNID